MSTQLDTPLHGNGLTSITATTSTRTSSDGSPRRRSRTRYLVTCAAPTGSTSTRSTSPSTRRWRPIPDRLSNIPLTSDGNAADGETHVVRRTRTVKENGAQRKTMAFGHYVDEWRRRLPHRTRRCALDFRYAIEGIELPLAAVGGARDSDDQVSTCSPTLA